MTVSRALVTLLQPHQALALNKIRGIAIQTLVVWIAMCMGGCRTSYIPMLHGVDELKVTLEIDSSLYSFSSHQLTVKLYCIDRRIADKAAVLLAAKEMRISHEKGQSSEFTVLLPSFVPFDEYDSAYISVMLAKNGRKTHIGSINNIRGIVPIIPSNREYRIELLPVTR